MVAGAPERQGGIGRHILENLLDHAAGAENIELVALIVEEFRDVDPH